MHIIALKHEYVKRKFKYLCIKARRIFASLLFSFPFSLADRQADFLPLIYIHTSYFAMAWVSSQPQRISF